MARKVILEKLQAESNEHVKGFLRKISVTFDTTNDIDFYLTCFCKTPDLLSQWRGYGTTSSRFCIGFDPHALLYEEKAETLENFHGVVVYEQNQQRKKIELAIDKACETLMKGRINNESFQTAVEGELIRKLLQELCFFKHAGFREEDEWRIVHSAHNASLIHFGGGLFKPCVDMVTATNNPPVLPITEILVRSALAKKSAELLLERYNYQDVNVRESSVPFREL